MDSDLLGSCGLSLEAEIYSDGVYSLARVDYRGRKLVAEISSSTGVFQHRWPSVRGLLTPVSARDLPGAKRLLLFDPGDRLFLSELLASSGGFSELRAVTFSLKALRIVTDLQSAGMICGYLGPEMFLISGENLLLLAGRRGVALSPFTPSEVGDSRPSDPRSDVSALGSLLFRFIAGTDNREKQLDSWNKLSEPYQNAIQDMVAAEPVNRPGSLKVVEEIFRSLSDEEKPLSPGSEPPVVPADSFIKTTSSSNLRNKKFWYIAVPIVLLLAFLVFQFSGPPSVDDSQESPVVPVDTALVEPPDSVPSAWVEDPVIQPVDPGYALEDTAKVWVSNCTGDSGVENRFRSGPLSGYSYVYPLIGTTERRTSLILVRRANPAMPAVGSELWQAAIALAATDSSLAVKPVDLTIMLGTDLSYAGINPQFFREPTAPAGTLYVDVVNHGIRYTLDGVGAATWAGRMLDNKSCTIDGEEWFVSISDIRDADVFNEEIGIPELLEETLFIHRGENTAAATVELLIRQYFQALPINGSFPVSDVPIPDLHVLLGTPETT